MELTDKHYNTIFEILENFDFEYVKKAMDLLDWKWYNNEEGNSEVPSIYNIKKRAREQLIDCAKLTLTSDSKEYTIVSGGFESFCKVYRDDFLYCSLKFVIADWDNSE